MYFTDSIDVEINDEEYSLQFEFEYYCGEIHLYCCWCDEYYGSMKDFDKFTEKMFDKARKVIDDYEYEKKIEKYENYYF